MSPAAAAALRSERAPGPSPTSSRVVPGTARLTSGSARTSTSWPLRGTSRAAQRITGLAVQPVPPPDRALPRAGPEGVGVHPRHQAHHPARGHRSEGGGDRQPGRLPEMGDGVRDRPDPPQERPGARGARPPHLVAVGGGHDPPHPGFPAQPVRHQGQRRGRAEPDPVAAVPPGQSGRPARDARRGQQHPGPVPDHRVRQRGVVRGGPGLGRGVDDHGTGGKAAGHRMDERLDAALPGREVVGDDESAGHRGVPSGSGRAAVPCCDTAQTARTSGYTR